MSTRALERELGVASGVVSRWGTGERRPEAHLRLALERVLGLRASDWMTDDEYFVAFGRHRRSAA